MLKKKINTERVVLFLLLLLGMYHALMFLVKNGSLTINEDDLANLFNISYSLLTVVLLSSIYNSKKHIKALGRIKKYWPLIVIIYPSYLILVNILYFFEIIANKLNMINYWAVISLSVIFITFVLLKFISNGEVDKK